MAILLLWDPGRPPTRAAGDAATNY